MRISITTDNEKKQQSNMKKIYVAGRFKDENIPDYIQTLKDKGYFITYNWTKHKELLPIYSSSHDIDGVKSCDILIAIMDDNEYAYRGTYCEIGCALGLDKRIIIVNPHEKSYCMEPCFYHHPIIEHVATFNDVLNLL